MVYNIISIFGEMRKYNLDTINKIFSALSESNRLRIIAGLHLRKMAVCEIREMLKLSFSTVSKHLSILKEAGLIKFEKEGKWVNYALSQNLPPEIKKILDQLLSFISEDERIKEDLKLAKSLDRNKICPVTGATSKLIRLKRRNRP